MLVLSLFLLLSLAYARVLIYQRFGDSVKAQKVKVLGTREVSRVDRIELHMEYGKSDALAYLYSGEERYQVILDVLWKVKSFVALEDVPKGSIIKLEMFRVEERFMKSLPSDFFKVLCTRLVFSYQEVYLIEPAFSKGIFWGSVFKERACDREEGTKIDPAKHKTPIKKIHSLCYLQV